jgi:alkylation response protein AidB-like acyl-CoA dehydrogenase
MARLETVARGGSFLLAAADPADVTTPESLGPEPRQIAQAAREFVTRAVAPRLDELEQHDWTVARDLLHQAGDLGFLALEIPGAYGGLDVDTIAATVVGQELGAGASFSVSFMVDTGIGTLPLVYFGTPEQKQRYLPGLARGELVSAYSLTETGSGSDALGARTTAELTPDGQAYLLRGTKQWTSNAGFADLFVVFAKIGGEQFTAFLVERGFPGVSIGAEEKKLGLHGSSTAQVILNDARVPVANLLHRPGKGHQVAFNMLNLGRFKLGAACLGASRHLLGVCSQYAQERQQFGRPIASFPLIRQKLAEMAVRTYALEAVVYRLAGLLRDSLADLDLAADVRDQAATRLAEYAVECSIAKVLGSETLFAVADEGVQLHGGYGFMQGYDVERAYRDCRINRIFEGTNEINRLLIPQTIFRRGQRGELPIAEAQAAARARLVRPGAEPADGHPFARERDLLATTRHLFWLIGGLARERFGSQVEEQQEVLALAADVAIAAFAMESALIRAERAAAEGAEGAPLHADLARSYVWGASRLVADRAHSALTYLAADAAEPPPAQLALVGSLELTPPFDRVGAGRRLADQILAANGWPLPA